MSNVIINKLSVFGQSTDIEKLIKDIQNDDQGRGSISFNKIIPCPLSPIDTSPAQYIAWNKKRWGVKSDACDCNVNTFDGETFIFTTAWSAATTVISILAAQYAHLSFILEAYDSTDFGVGVIKAAWSHGTCDIYNILPSYSDEACAVASNIEANL